MAICLLELLKGHTNYHEGLNCTVVWQGYTFDLDLAYLTGLGLPASKIVYGIMPGHADAGEGVRNNSAILMVMEYGRLGE